MDIKCRVCKSNIIVDSSKYSPGEVVEIECKRCGEIIEVQIPEQTLEFPDSKTSDEEKTKKDAKKHLEEKSYRNNSSDFEKPKDASKLKDLKQKSDPVSISTPPPFTGNYVDGSVSSDDIKSGSGHEKTDIKENIKSNQKNKNSRSKTNPAKKNAVPNKNNIDIDQQPPVKKRGCFNGGCLIIFVLVAAFSVLIYIYFIKSTPMDNEVVPDDSTISYKNKKKSEIDSILNTVHAHSKDSVIVISEDLETNKPTYPALDNYTSSEAYNVLADLITDERLGEKWMETDLIRRAKANGDISSWIDAYGKIDGHEAKFKAVILQDGRVYGRYHNVDYNVRLDINGIIDENNNLCLKLGHKSATSYWILLKDYNNTDGGLHYRGTWGLKNKITELDITFKSYPNEEDEYDE